LAGIAAFAVAATTAALAAAPPTGSGQPGAPNLACGTGNAVNAPNGFSSGGFQHAGTVYAGSPGTASAQNANSPHAISQYDVACFQQTQRTQSAVTRMPAVQQAPMQMRQPAFPSAGARGRR
jgi:hypothetical protein